MAVTKIHGERQIQDATIKNAQIAADAAIALSKLAEAVVQADGGQAFTADQSMGGNKLTNLGAPTADSDAATKGYVDGALAGLSWKDPVRVATTANITLSGTQTIDGVALTAGQRVLVKNQTAPEDNGIYVVAAGAWARAADADSAAELEHMAVFVMEGSTLADTQWVLTTNAPITVGTTGLTYAQFGASTGVNAGAGLTQSGNTIDVAAADNSLVVGTDDIAVKRDNAGAVGLTASGLRVEVDGTTIERSGNALRIAATAAGDGLTGGGASALAVNPGDGIEIASDAVRVKLDGASISRGASGIKVNMTAWVVRETPSGALNGSNTTYTLANTPIAGSEQVYLNGLLQEPGAGNDYTISGATITYLTAPLTGDRIRVSYMRAL